MIGGRAGGSRGRYRPPRYRAIVGRALWLLRDGPPRQGDSLSRAGRRALGLGRLNPVLPALLGAAAISSSAIAVRLAGTPAGTTAFYRCLIALPVLYPLALLEGRNKPRRSWRLRLRSLVAGGFFGVDLFLWNHAIYAVGAGVATVLGNLQVIFVTAAAWAVFNERPRRQFLFALPVVLSGVFFVSGLAGTEGPGYRPIAGVCYGLGTALSYAAFILILRKSTAGSRYVAGPLADATAGGALMALVLGLGFSELPFSVSSSALGWLAFLALVSQSFGWLLITSALPRLPAAVASLLLLLQPTMSLVLAAVFLSERPSALQLFGAALVCVGVVLAARSRVEDDPVTAPEPTPG